MTNDYLLLIVKFVGLNAQKILFFSSTTVRNSNHDAFFLFLSLIYIYIFCLREQKLIMQLMHNIRILSRAGSIPLAAFYPPLQKVKVNIPVRRSGVVSLCLVLVTCYEL